MRDLRDFFSPHMTATIAGHQFTVECPNAETGLWLRTIMADPELASKESEIKIIHKLFKGTYLPKTAGKLPKGGLWDELWEHNVTWPEAVHLGMTAVHYFGFNEQAAIAYWESAGDNSEAVAEDDPKG